MQYRSLIGLSFVGFASLMSAACSNAEPTMRNVTGTVPVSDNVTTVVAMEVGNVAHVINAPVDASGHFSITLPIGQRFYLAFQSNTQTVGAVRYMSSSGAYKSVINVTHAPGVSPTLKPASEDEVENEVEDADSEDDGIEDDSIDLGDVDNPAGDDKYEPSQNPEEECDSDGDGEDDFDDDSEEAEGEADEDTDADGLPDVVDTDDDGDGTPDA